MKYMLLCLFLVINASAMDSSQENPFAAHEISFNQACNNCKTERANCEKIFKYKACVHATEPKDGFCAPCLENYEKRKATVLERVQNLIAGLPACLASKITANQIQLTITNSTHSKYLLRHRPYIGMNKSEGFLKDINAGDTFVMDPLDLGPQQHYMLNVKRYSSGGQLILDALIIALSKEHNCFSIIQSKREGQVTTFTEEKKEVRFNSQDRYLFTLKLNEECIHNSVLALEVQTLP